MVGGLSILKSPSPPKQARSSNTGHDNDALHTQPGAPSRAATLPTASSAAQQHHEPQSVERGRAAATHSHARESSTHVRESSRPAHHPGQPSDPNQRMSMSSLLNTPPPATRPTLDNILNPVRDRSSSPQTRGPIQPPPVPSAQQHHQTPGHERGRTPQTLSDVSNRPGVPTQSLPRFPGNIFSTPSPPQGLATRSRSSSPAVQPGASSSAQGEKDKGKKKADKAGPGHSTGFEPQRPLVINRDASSSPEAPASHDARARKPASPAPASHERYVYCCVCIALRAKFIGPFINPPPGKVHSQCGHQLCATGCVTLTAKDPEPRLPTNLKTDVVPWARAPFTYEQYRDRPLGQISPDVYCCECYKAGDGSANNPVRKLTCRRGHAVCLGCSLTPWEAPQESQFRGLKWRCHACKDAGYDGWTRWQVGEFCTNRRVKVPGGRLATCGHGMCIALCIEQQPKVRKPFQGERIYDLG